MTPKEAITNIETYLTAHGLQDSPSWLEIKQAIRELEELKRYPTSDEVCEAFYEYYTYNIKYDEKSREFRFEDNSNITKFGIFGYQVVVYLPPSLITLIGRFYEGLEK